MNSNILKLYTVLDDLNRDIGSVCKKCNFPCCVGYAWLLADEVESLLDIDVPIVEINDSTAFIHSFEEENGEIMVDRPKPPCRWRGSSACSIYESRPLVCRMYPVGLATHNNEVVVVLHQDCEYSRGLDEQSKEQFFDRIVKILRQIPVGLLNEFFNCYLQVDRLSVYPEGPNAFEVIISLEEIINTRKKERRQ